MGIMDAELLQDLGERIEASLNHVLSQAAEMEAYWRSQEGE